LRQCLRCRRSRPDLYGKVLHLKAEVLQAARSRPRKTVNVPESITASIPDAGKLGPRPVSTNNAQTKTNAFIGH
jgi:hypothetical protein